MDPSTTNLSPEPYVPKVIFPGLKISGGIFPKIVVPDFANIVSPGEGFKDSNELSGFALEPVPLELEFGFIYIMVISGVGIRLEFLVGS